MKRLQIGFLSLGLLIADGASVNAISQPRAASWPTPCTGLCAQLKNAIGQRGSGFSQYKTGRVLVKWPATAASLGGADWETRSPFSDAHCIIQQRALKMNNKDLQQESLSCVFDIAPSALTQQVKQALPTDWEQLGGGFWPPGTDLRGYDMVASVGPEYGANGSLSTSTGRSVLQIFGAPHAGTIQTPESSFETVQLEALSSREVKGHGVSVYNVVRNIDNKKEFTLSCWTNDSRPSETCLRMQTGQTYFARHDKDRPIRYVVSFNNNGHELRAQFFVDDHPVDGGVLTPAARAAAAIKWSGPGWYVDLGAPRFVCGTIS